MRGGAGAGEDEEKKRRKSVKSEETTLRSIINQQSCFRLCFATSSLVYPRRTGLGYNVNVNKYKSLQLLVLYILINIINTILIL